MMFHFLAKLIVLRLVAGYLLAFELLSRTWPDKAATASGIHV